jgi:hypothetical protein
MLIRTVLSRHTSIYLRSEPIKMRPHRQPGRGLRCSEDATANKDTTSETRGYICQAIVGLVNMYAVAGLAARRVSREVLPASKRCSSSHNKLCDPERLLKHCNMAGRQCNCCGVHPLRQPLLQISSNHLILSGDNDISEPPEEESLWTSSTHPPIPRERARCS